MIYLVVFLVLSLIIGFIDAFLLSKGNPMSISEEAKMYYKISFICSSHAIKKGKIKGILFYLFNTIKVTATTLVSITMIGILRICVFAYKIIDAAITIAGIIVRSLFNIITLKSFRSKRGNIHED